MILAEIGPIHQGGQTWDPFRPAKPSALVSLGAKVGPARRSLGAMIGRGSATYARHRPNQLVRASAVCSSSTDGVKSEQVEKHKIASAPVPVSSSTVSNALGKMHLLQKFQYFFTMSWMDERHVLSVCQTRGDACQSITCY